MKKIINRAEDVVKEMMEGFVLAYQKFYKKHPSVNGVILKPKRKGKVALVIGGGSGHEPMFSGFVGQGLADAAACGNIFASPDPNTVYETAKAVESGKGVLFVYGCYAGDNLNFDMGEELLQGEGIPTRHVRVWDDVASAPRERMEDRRGIAGDVFVIKVAGAACDAGLSLEEVTRITEKARDSTNTIGVATSPGQIPGLHKPTFELGEDEIEYGMGLHGEPGIKRTTMQSADVLAEELYENMIADIDIEKGNEVCVLINGLGSTTIAELAIVYRKVEKLLRRDGITVYDSDLNSFCTCQEMGGFSITLLQLDQELKKYYDMPCYCPYYAKLGRESGIVLEELDDALENEAKIPATHANREETHETRKELSREKENLTEIEVKEMLVYIADKVIEQKDYLTAIDSAIGDGDHGLGMSGGMKKAKEALQILEETNNVYTPFEVAGKAMLMSMGGASGVIFGSLYLEGTKGMQSRERLTAKDIAQMERKSLEAIKQRGKAQVGDKTMIDALEPAVESLEATCNNGLWETLQAAETSAKIGVEATKGYIAKFGRAKSLMERAIGFQDAGATSVWLIFQGMREYIENKKCK